MIDITFKNVGQGDSIIIEWEKDLSNKIGIIDCNLYEGRNPVLDHIISSGFKEIEFIILSHPHYDHFSGIRNLLEYCDVNKIVIKKFLHTSQQVPDFLRVSTKSIISSKELCLLFLKIKELRISGIIEFVTYISDELRDINLTNEISLKFLAPSSVEYENFLSRTPLFDQEDSHNNAQANWLSTIIKIFTINWYILLTSDSIFQTLKRVGIQKKIEFASNLSLAQSPHHGAKSNHYDSFWKTKKHFEKTPIVFSVGSNIYNHPSEKAVTFFSELKHNYKIFSTNQVGNLNEFASNPKSDIINAYLDLSGSQEIVFNNSETQFSGDQIFNLIS